MKREDINLVVIRVFTSQTDAEITRSFLAANGIDCSLVHGTAASVLPLQSQDFGIQLVARAEDKARIEELLASGFEGPFPDTEAEHQEL